MKKFISAAVLLAATILFSTAASAVSLSLAGGGYTPYTLNSIGAFDLAGLGIGNASISVLNSGAKNSSNGLMVDGPGKVTYTLLGKEAVNVNRLRLSTGALIFGVASAVGSVSLPYDVVAGLLPFKLTSNGDPHYVFNDGAANSNMNIAYLKLTDTSWLVLLDDYGAGPDVDFDDIGIRVDVAAIPVPAALPLLGAGLGVLGLLARRQRKLRLANTSTTEAVPT